ncbi:MAG: ketol-acid reductoisomerase, partial [Humisphaera sp.]|nr:ketol-acid reductoisomerase [Humisphaera sp.]
MSEKIYRDADVDSSILKTKTIAVIGYGIQGKAQAANTRDSGFKVIIGCRGADEGSKSREQAKADGFEAFSIADATKKADILLIELADPVQPAIYKKVIAPNLRAGQTLCFCHGFSVLYGQITPPKDVNTVLFVPNAPGVFVRE